jgi:uncharacterized protein
MPSFMPPVENLPRLRTLAEVAAFARERFDGARGSHDWEHTRRVHAICMHIGRRAGADLAVLGPAAYLHDIGRHRQDASGGAVCHAREGAATAAALLADYPLAPDQLENVLHCIATHRYRGGRAPRTLEARILFDADKLDAIGAVGIARTFLFAGEVGARLHNPEVAPEDSAPYTSDDTGYREFKLKLSKIRDRMLTDEGRRMAADRHRFMERFFERFLAEYDAMC